MNLDVKNLVVGPFGQKESFSVEYYNEKIDDEVLAERTRGKVELTRLEDEVMGSFDGQARVKLFCDRCLAEFCYEIPLKFKAEFVIGRDPEEEDKFRVSKDFQIDFWEVLRQELGARVPVKKLCQTECKGLCATCGKNRNVEDCKCKNGQ